MEPRIQYAKTEDGVNIAYWTLGEGKPLIVTPAVPFNSSLRSWQTPEGRRWYERLAEKRRVVRYDNRGSGDSERGHVESLDNLVHDLEAVTIDHPLLRKRLPSLLPLAWLPRARLPAIARHGN